MVEKFKESLGKSFPLPGHRLRRLRRKPALRSLLAESAVTVSDLVYPLFIKEGIESAAAISSMPGQYQWPLAGIAEEAKRVFELGIPAVLLFGIPTHPIICQHLSASASIRLLPCPFWGLRRNIGRYTHYHL